MIYRFVFLYVSVVYAELEMVQVLLRHGDRAPSFTYPTDIDLKVEQHFPRGFSQLTEQGYAQAKELGSFLKHKYQNLVSKYNRKDVLIRSSDKDRCIETAMGLTTTLFPDEIVPVHTYSDYKLDLLLKPNSVKCPKVEEIVRNEKMDWIYSTNLQYAEFFQMLSNKTGWTVDANNIADVFNVIYRKYVNNIPQPSWVMEVMDTVVELKRQSRMLSFNSYEKSKLRTGYLLGEITRNMENRARKMTIYSSHDATVTSLMYSLGVSDHQLPPYTSAILVESHKIDGKQYVRVLYRNDTTVEPHALILPGCHGMELCPWNAYRATVTHRIVENRKEHEKLCTSVEPMNIEIPEAEEVHDILMDDNDDELSTLITVGVVSMVDFMSSLKSK